MDQSQYSNPLSFSDALCAWVFWAEALERADADQLVKGRERARIALVRIYEEDIQTDQMKAWLRQWPTPFGLEQYLRVAG